MSNVVTLSPDPDAAYEHFVAEVSRINGYMNAISELTAMVAPAKPSKAACAAIADLLQRMDAEATEMARQSLELG